MEAEASRPTIEQIRSNLIALQSSLGEVLTGALNLFDAVMTRAYTPLQLSDQGRPDHPICFVRAINEPSKNSEGKRLGALSFLLPAGSIQGTLSIERNSEGAPDAFPRQRIIHWGKHNPKGIMTKTDILRTHDPRRVNNPYDISVAEFNGDGRCTNLLGTAYTGLDLQICNVQQAVADAKALAEAEGYRTY